jgi:GWxTD domain-containing protein
MRIRICTAALIASAIAVSAMAAPGDLDWGKGPARFLMTKEESAEWKSLRTDEEAAAFIALFWARRDPTPATPRNEFREEHEARVAWADKNIAEGERVRGSLTDRGKVFVLFGAPTTIMRSPRDRSGSAIDPGEVRETERETRDWFDWIYEESPSVKALFGAPRARLRFVDRFNTRAFTLDRGHIDMPASMQRAILAAIKSPDLTAPPQFAPAPAPAAPSPALAPAPAPALATPALLAAVSAYRQADGNPGTQAAVAWGEYETGTGSFHVPVILSVPRGSVLRAGQSVTFFGSIRDAAGTNLATFEKDAKLVESKGDLFVEHSLDALPAGRYEGVFGMAQDGRPVVMATSPLEFAGAGDRAASGASPLILSNHVYQLSEAWAPNAPFVFGGLKVVPKADRVFRASDDLWFFAELRNPGVTARVQSDGGRPMTGPTPVIQVKLDVEGVDAEGKSVKRASPPREVQTIAISGVDGHYGLGDAIPLTSFRPGTYTLSVKIIDTVSKKSYLQAVKFNVVE